MVSPQEQITQARSTERIALQCAIVIGNGIQVGEGRVFNMSVHGCLVDGPVLVQVGDHLWLRLFLHDTDPSMCVSLAVVRWAQGFRFGVEFMVEDEKHRARLNHFIALLEDPGKLAH